MKFEHILIKNIENKYAKFQLHNLHTKLMPRVRMCGCQWIGSNIIFDGIII